MLVGFTGDEAISRPFSYRLELVSEDHEIDASAVLRNPVTITVRLPNGSERAIHGVVRRFMQMGSRDDLAFYAADVVPWLWFLSLSRDCRVFQDKTVVEIFEEVFRSRGYTDYDIACTHSYPAREYCVQYNESDLDFVSRLMEEEGIFYSFKHTASAHVLILADTNGNMDSSSAVATARVSDKPGPGEDAITRLAREDAVRAGKVTLGDFDPLQPSLTLRNSISNDGNEEIYEYQPVVYTAIEEGDRYARVRLEAEEALRRVIHGSGTCRTFQAGCRIDVEGHYRSDMNGHYLITHVQHAARGGGYSTGDDASFEYTNEFVAIPFDVPYRTPHTTPKPTVHGTQTAIVVGKGDEEIWTDKHGRVKVQFHWDRLGEKDENSSCWVRVATTWAGASRGALAVPRVGDEVVIDFLEGDVNRPIILGSVYNAERRAPFPLPDWQTISGIRSRSSKGGGLGDYNEIVFEDKAGEEQLSLLAANDLMLTAFNDLSVVAGNNRKEQIEQDDTITIGANRAKEVKGDESITVKGARNAEITGSDSVVVKGSCEHEVKGSAKRVVGASRSTSVKTNDELKVGANLGVVARAINVKAGAKIVLEANAEIELKVGASAVKVTPAGIELKAPQIKLEGMAQVELKAPIVTGQADAILDMKGAIAQVNGDGMLTVRGGITMIN